MQVTSLRLQDTVEFLGPVAAEEMPALIARASIVLLPSRREGLPLVALEAAGCRRPIVGTAVGGIPEFVVHERTGLIVPPEHPVALADAICALLSDKDRVTEMGHAAFERVRTLFSWEQPLAEYEELYWRLRDARSFSRDVSYC